MVGGPNGPGLTPQKTSNFWRKKLRLLEFFWEKNSSPIFSKLVRARAINPFILLVGTIKPCNFYSQHFLFRPFLSKIFAGPFHRAKTMSQGRTVFYLALVFQRKCCHNSFCEIVTISFYYPQNSIVDKIFFLHLSAVAAL